LIAYSIEHARCSQAISRMIVSTDDPEIAEIARHYGAEVPFLRPSRFAQDDSIDFDVFHHALAWLEREENYRCEAVVHLRPTGPIRDSSVIDRAIELLLSNPEADSVRSVSRPKQSPYKMWTLEKGYLKPLLSLQGVIEPFNLPRQGLPQVFWQNGYVDVIRSMTILQKGQMTGERVLPIQVEESLMELDYPEDIPRIEDELIRRKLKTQASNQKTSRYSV